MLFMTKHKFEMRVERMISKRLSDHKQWEHPRGERQVKVRHRTFEGIRHRSRTLASVIGDILDHLDLEYGTVTKKEMGVGIRSRQLGDS